MARGEDYRPKTERFCRSRQSGERPADPNEIAPTPHAEPKSARRAVLPPIRGPPVAPWPTRSGSFARRIPSAWTPTFVLQRAGLGPVTMKVGGRTLISVEAAAAWRRDRELAAQEARHQRKTEAAEENVAT